MSKQISVLHLSTHNEDCGIAKYQQHVVDGMGERRDIRNIFFEVSPNKLKLMAGAELESALQQLYDQMADFDILHVQHEYSFYYGNELERIVSHVKGMGKKVIVTMHTAPAASSGTPPPPQRTGLGPRSLLHYYRLKKSMQMFMQNHIRPMQLADIVVAPNNVTKDNLVQFGVPEANIRVIEHPIPPVDTKKQSTRIAESLQRRHGDVIYATVGFLSKAKGILQAVKALTYLPENYKLAIIGGAHPSGLNDEFYDEVCDTIRDLGLQKRVYITGYVADDAELDALIREADLCVYAYNREYYGYVSSAAISNAVANGRPIVAYPTASLLETNQHTPFVIFTQAFSYYELARAIQGADLQDAVKRTKAYAKAFALPVQAVKFAGLYEELAAN